MDSAESRTYRRLCWLTALLGIAVFFWGLGDIALMSFNEARRAIPARAMLQSGDWLLPHLNGELYLTKPPLLYWLAASASFLFGTTNEWAVRLPSALAATLTLWMVYRYVQREFGRWPALFSAQLLIANVSFAMFARRAEIEMLLTALCAGALLAAMHYVRTGDDRRWIWLSYLLLALAMLTKGPLVLLFVTLPLLLVAVYTKDQRSWEVLRNPVGWVVFLLVGLSWYAVVTWQLGTHIWTAIAQRDMVEKIQSEQGKPFLSYMLWILVDFLPACLLLLLHPAQIWQRCRIRPDYLLLLAALLVPLLIFSLFSNKHAKYLLPAYPFIAVLLAVHVNDFFSRAGLPVKRLVMAIGVLLPLGYLGYYVSLEARIFDYRVAAFAPFNRWSHGLQSAPLYAYRDIDERLIYYAGRDIQLLDAASLKQQMEAKKPMLLLVESARIDEVRPQADCLVREFAPYLKKHKILAVFGFGTACQAAKTTQ